MKLKIDFHVHTDKSSDGLSTLADVIKSAKAKGFDAIAIADHDLLSEPYDDGELIIIPACECSTIEGHILALFIDALPPSLYASTGILPHADVIINEIHALGGVAVWAHPFEHFDNLPHNMVALCDGIEIYNSRACFKKTNANEMAQKLALELDKPQFGGSDAHHSDDIGDSYTIIECADRSLDSIRAGHASDAIFVRNTKRLRKGMTQLEKCRRKGASPLRMAKAYIYLLYCLILDLIKG